MKKKLSESDHFSKKNRTTLLIWNVALFPTLLLFYPFPHTQNVLSWLRISVFPITSLMVTFQPHVCKCSFRVQCLLLPHSDLSLFCCFCLFGVWGGGHGPRKSQQVCCESQEGELRALPLGWNSLVMVVTGCHKHVASGFWQDNTGWNDLSGKWGHP